MMTKDDARKKWCPFARLATTKTSGFNRVAPLNADNTMVDIDAAPMMVISLCCIASECMAFRTISEYRGDTNETVTRGYCGLAGKP